MDLQTKNTTKQKKTREKKPVNKKKIKKIIKRIVIFAILIAALIFILNKFGILDRLLGKQTGTQGSTLTTYTVGTRSISQVLSSSGTITPNDEYTINALVSGEILADYFDEGDTVVEDQILYNIDSESMSSNVTRAENSLKNANKSLESALENLEKLNVESDYTGTIKEIHVEIGDEINAGTLIADIVDDSVMCIDIPFMEVDIAHISVGDTAVITFTNYEEAKGKVTKIGSVSSVNNLGVATRLVTISVNNSGSITTSSRAYAQIGEAYCTSDAAFYYNDEGKIYAEVGGEVDKILYDEGDRISKGQFIIKLESEDLEDQIENLRDNVKEAQDSLEDANDAYDNYNIKAPITGKVISKNYKTGDTISGSGMSSGGELAVIYDMSALKFTMSIDELDIDKLDKGQEVIVTCDSRSGETYYGTVTNISIQGSTSSGTTVYPVEVTIENVEDTSKRTTDEDGTVNKVYKTGMTSTEKLYAMISAENLNDGTTVYTYSDDVIIKKLPNGSLLDGTEVLNAYLNGKYTQGSSFYDFAPDFSTLTLEVQNDKKMLRPGMNIDAEIIVEQKENVIAVPLDAVGRGNVVKVLKNTSDASSNSTDGNSSRPSRENMQMPEGFEGQMPQGFDGQTPPEFNGDKIPEQFTDASGGQSPEGMEIQMPEGVEIGDMPAITFDTSAGSYGSANANAEYEEVRVTIGIDDGDYVEITSGLEVGDVVIVDTQTSSGSGDFIMMSVPGGMGMGMGMSMGMGGGMHSMGGSGGPPSGMGGGGMGGQRPSFG